MTKEELIKAAGGFLVAYDLENPNSIRKLTLVVIRKDHYVGTNQECAEQDPGNPNQVYTKDFCWPVQAYGELHQVLAIRNELRAALDDSMKLVYELNNKISRGEFQG